MTPVSRIPLLDEGEAAHRAIEHDLPAALAQLNVFRVLLHHPPLAKWHCDFLMGLLWQSELDHRLRELAIMRIGWTTGSEYEWTQHWPIAKDLGVSEDDLLGVRDWPNHAGFSDADRAVLAATDEVLDEGAVSAATWAACLEHVSREPRVLLELVSAIGLWRMVSSLLRSVEIPLEDSVAGWPPDGTTPSEENR